MLENKVPFETPKLEILNWMLDYLPPIISRKRVGHFTGGLVTAKTLANHDARGTGPRVVLQTCSGVAYPAPILLEWLENNMQTKMLLISQKYFDEDTLNQSSEKK